MFFKKILSCSLFVFSLPAESNCTDVGIGEGGTENSLLELKELILSKGEGGFSSEEIERASSLFKDILPDVGNMNAKWDVVCKVLNSDARPRFEFVLRKSMEPKERLLYGTVEILEEQIDLEGLSEVNGFPSIDLNNGKSIVIHPGRAVLTIHSDSKKFDSYEEIEKFAQSIDLQALSAL